jgi:hypothetical protein
MLERVAHLCLGSDNPDLDKIGRQHPGIPLAGFGQRHGRRKKPVPGIRSARISEKADRGNGQEEQSPRTLKKWRHEKRMILFKLAR